MPHIIDLSQAVVIEQPQAQSLRADVRTWPSFPQLLEVDGEKEVHHGLQEVKRGM